jgi:hypothetical protein
MRGAAEDRRVRQQLSARCGGRGENVPGFARFVVDSRDA